MIISDPIQMRIQAFGDAAFSLLHEQYENKTPIKIGEKEFVAINVDRKFSGQETTDCGSNIQEFRRVQMPWKGEGLPSVGTVCEFQGDCAKCPSDPWHKELHDGVKCTVIAHFKSKNLDLVAFTFVKADGNSELEQALPGALRPIRTPEQIAAEERDKARTEILNAMTADGRTEGENEENWQFRMQIVGEMLDMGYRKFEIVDN